MIFKEVKKIYRQILHIILILHTLVFIIFTIVVTFSNQNNDIKFRTFLLILDVYDIRNDFV